MTASDRTSRRVETPTGVQSDPFDSLWRFFSSTKLAIVLILAIAFVSFLGAFIIQAPGSIANDPIEYGRWLSTIRGRYGAITDIYNVLGLFNVYNVFWFKSLLVLLIFNTIICTVNRLPALWGPVFSPRVRVNESMFRSAPIRANVKLKQRGGARPTKDVAEAAFAALADRRYKVFSEEEAGVKHFYADRYGIFKLGTLVTHLSLVILMVGAVMGGLMGFSDDNVIIPEGKAYQVPFGENFLVRADQFKAEFYQDGRPKDYWSDLVVIDGGKEVAKQRIRVNEPLEYKGVRFHQSFYGPAPVVEVKDKQGKVVFSDITPLASGNGSSNVGWIDLPGTDLTFLLALNAGGDATSPLAVQIYKGQVPLGRDALKVNETKSIGDYQVTYKALKQFTGLRVVKDPGVPVVWLACALLVLGICITLYFPRRRIWGRITQQEILLAGSADKMVNFRPEFDKLVEAIRKV